MKEGYVGTIFLKSGFHYFGKITMATSDWIKFLDLKTRNLIEIRMDSIDHFVPSKRVHNG